MPEEPELSQSVGPVACVKCGTTASLSRHFAISARLRLQAKGWFGAWPKADIPPNHSCTRKPVKFPWTRETYLSLAY